MRERDQGGSARRCKYAAIFSGIFSGARHLPAQSDICTQRRLTASAVSSDDGVYRVCLLTLREPLHTGTMQWLLSETSTRVGRSVQGRKHTRQPCAGKPPHLLFDGRGLEGRRRQRLARRCRAAVVSAAVPVGPVRQVAHDLSRCHFKSGVGCKGDCADGGQRRGRGLH